MICIFKAWITYDRSLTSKVSDIFLFVIYWPTVFFSSAQSVLKHVVPVLNADWLIQRSCPKIHETPVHLSVTVSFSRYVALNEHYRYKYSGIKIVIFLSFCTFEILKNNKAPHKYKIFVYIYFPGKKTIYLSNKIHFLEKQLFDIFR